MKKIGILGSTGSIGKQALDVVKQHPNKFTLIFISAKSNVDLQAIRKELNKVNDKGKLPDGAYADLMTAQEQRGIVLSNQTSSSQQADGTIGLRPSKKPKR